MDDTIIKKKRGRKPKNFYQETAETEPELLKKKRGRKKKYEIENSEKLLNREHPNNFNHSVIYSDDEETSMTDTVKNVSFGNLNITVSRKPINSIEDFRSKIIEKSKKSLIDENEYSDEETPLPENEHFEKHYTENEKYTPEANVINKEQSLKRLRVVTTLKNVIQEDSWPESCDVCCWWCCHQFEGSPCTLPTKYDPLRKRFTFTGIFCSWNCTKAYNIDRNDHMKHERSAILSLLVKNLSSVDESICIKAAPARQCLKMFGGYMDIEQFRAPFSTVDAYLINDVNSNFIYPEVTEVSNIKIKNEKKNLRLSRK